MGFLAGGDAAFLGETGVAAGLLLGLAQFPTALLVGFASAFIGGASGPCVVLALDAPDAIKKWRTLMGATDPAKADASTLRKEFGQSIENNATHGSDAPDTAAFELGYFFRGMEV